MRFDEKARENLEAAERLLPDARGVFDALPNAAASRTYYAAYLAVADRAQGLRREFTDERETYYRHDRLPDDAVRWGLVDDDGADDLRWLRDLRIKADYFQDQIELEEASQAFEVAQELVSMLLKESP